MKNALVCNSCRNENPIYALNCSKCKAFLRSKISNIDLWQTTWKIFYSPIKTLESIIQSDHKNFVILLLFLCCLKFSFVKSMVFNSMKGSSVFIDSFSSSIFSGGLFFVLSLVCFALLMTLLNKLNGIKSRFKDNLAIYTYSFIPLLLGMLVLIPINYALFGEYWFTFNPSPFIIKETAATTLVLIDAILFLWSIGIIMAATYAQSRNKLYSVFSGMIMLSIIFVVIYYLPVIL